MAGSYTPAVGTIDDELITYQQAAKHLKVTVNTVRSMVSRAELPAWRCGPRAVRIRRSDLDRVLTPIDSDDSATLATTEDQRAAQIAGYIETVLAQAPPLSDEQRNRLAELLRPARKGGGPCD
jgi:excisionase family DNA binding protein